MKREKKRKGVIRGWAAVFFCMAVLLTGCSQNQLSDKYDEETVKTAAEEAIGYFNEKDYQSIIDMGSQQLKDSITAEQFAEAGDPYLEKCGEFEKISKTVVTGSSDKETETEYAVVVMIGKYAEGTIQFSIAFDEEMQLIQFLIK